MANYNCELKTGVVFRRVCARPKAYTCTDCSISICFDHTYQKETPGSELCQKCYLSKNEKGYDNYDRNDWRRHHYYRDDHRSRTRYNERNSELKSGSENSDLAMGSTVFTEDDYTAFDQLNDHGNLEMDDSYDS